MTDWKSSKKYLAFDSALEKLAVLKESGMRIVQCHGTFDLVHPGHVVHFEEAKSLGDVLVVTFTSEEYVNKGPGRPYFNDALRFKSLASLESIDHVIAIPFSAAVEAIEVVQPDVYCKGKEYEEHSNDITGNIADDVVTVERLGGEIRYVGSVVFSSTKLLNRNFDTQPPAVKSFCGDLAERVDSQAFRKAIDEFSKLKVLVLGDLIFDRYTTVGVQGLTSKNRILSSRYEMDDMQAGGALAVFRHLRQFTSNVSLAGYVGKESWVDSELSNYVDKASDSLVRDENFTTIVKQRFVEPQKDGVELSKLFSINYIDEEHPNGELSQRLLDQLDRNIADYDLVLVMDFGHGVMASEVRKLVQERSRFLGLNCQTNSNNYGFNIINRQYERADSFSLDKAEITLACGKQHFDHDNELAKLRDQFDSSYAWLTRGQIETLGLRRGGEAVSVAPFESRVVDTIGAGDAFCALASLAAVSELPIDLATFIGQLAGGQAVTYVGNREHVSKIDLLKAGMAMLNR